MELFADAAGASLNGAINNSVTSLTVDNGVNVPASGTFRALIDTELLKVTAVSGATWTVVRGDGGTTAASHADDASIYIVATKESLDALVSVQAAGTEVSNRRVLNFTGATVADDATNSRVNITIPSWEAAWTAPVPGDFTWVNQGSATVTTVGNTQFLRAPAVAGNNVKGLEITPGAAPWHVVAKIIPQMFNASYTNCGLFYRESSSGKIITQEFTFNLLQVQDCTSPTGTRSNSVTISAASYSPLTWVKLNDDGTNRNIYLSVDGLQWSLLLSESNTTYMAADRVGWFAESNQGTYDACAKLVSWLFTSGSA